MQWQAMFVMVVLFPVRRLPKNACDKMSKKGSSSGDLPKIKGSPFARRKTPIEVPEIVHRPSMNEEQAELTVGYTVTYHAGVLWEVLRNT